MLKIMSHLLASDIRRIDGKEARRQWWDFRIANGFCAGADLLSEPGTNMKLVKDNRVIYGLSFAQARESGVANMCPFSTIDCRFACIAREGNGRYSSAQAGRSLRVKFLVANPSACLSLLAWEIDRAVAKHGADNVGFRLNTFSDVAWEAIVPWLFLERPNVQFYDYTKNWDRLNVPANYHLTYSVSELTTDKQIADYVSFGLNVAVVFSTKRKADLPASFLGFDVVDGDKSDARYADPSGVVVGLRAKGRLRHSGRAMVRAA